MNQLDPQTLVVAARNPNSASSCAIARQLADALIAWRNSPTIRGGNDLRYLASIWHGNERITSSQFQAICNEVLKFQAPKI